MPLPISLASLTSRLGGAPQRLREKYAWITSLQRVNIALARGAATSAQRTIDPTNPTSWEFCAFSQNQEDGIIDYLCRHLKRSNRYFVEIGSHSGLENNTMWLAVGLRYNGLMLDGNGVAVQNCKALLSELTVNAECRQMFVEPDNCAQVAELAIYRDPDFLSLDIDGVDYFVMRGLFEAGFRPKVVAVEYNSAFGPTNSLSINYRANFNYLQFHESGLYYGTSVQGWKAFFGNLGYHFISVDSNGVNAFFVDRQAFNPAFLDNIRGRNFQENFYQASRFRKPWEQQFDVVKHLDFHEIQ